MLKNLLLKFVIVLFLTIQISAQKGDESVREISPQLESYSQSNPTEAMWDVLFNYNAQTVTSALGNAGAVYIPTLNQFWTARWASGWIHAWNPNGTLIDSFTIAGVTGTRNMVFDGQFVYHAVTTGVIYRVNPTTRTLVNSFNLPAGVTARFITYDPQADGGNGGFWVGNWNAGALNYFLVSKTGAQLSVISNTTITGTYGIAYDYWSPGGPFLWVWHQGSGAGTPQMIRQLSIATGQPTGVERNVVPDIAAGDPNAIAGGMFITPDLVTGKVVLGGMLQGTPDRLFGYEIHVLDAGVLQPFALNSPASGITLTSFPGSTTPVTVTWDTSRANATYKWVFGAPTTANWNLVQSSGTNQISFTLGQLDGILAGLGLNPGDSLVGQWDVWAYRNNPPNFDSLKSSNGPRAITLKRGVPALTPFNLNAPANNSSITVSTQSNAPININWTRSGQGTNYKWKLGTSLVESKESAIWVVPSNNNGYDSTLTLISSAVDAFLAGQNLLPGDSINSQWTVYAYNGLDSLRAAQTFNITLKRQAKGEVLVAYDSSTVGGRESRDTVVAYLNRKGITYDLYNKGTITNATSWTFRDYKTVIWLGQATNTMSLVQRDSLKAYMNAGGPMGLPAGLIIFAEDVGYQHGRSGSTNIDLNFVNNYLGWNYVADRPPSGANQGLVGDYFNFNMTDSTIGTWPDVISSFDPNTTYNLYRYRSDNTVHAIGKNGANYNAVTYCTDVRSLRRANDSPPGATIDRFLNAALYFVRWGVIPVELTSFTASTGGNAVMLEWTTATETNNQGFHVERRLVGSEYQSVAFVEGKGTTIEQNNYRFVDAGLTSGKYNYRLRQVDFDGTTSYSDEIEIEVIAPVEFALEQNYPNPFNPVTTIKYSLASDEIVELSIYNLLGQKVATLVNQFQEAGYYELQFDATRFASGVYFYRIDAGNFNSIKKMILLK